MIKGLVFDVDGVIIDSEKVHHKAFNGVLTRYDYQLNDASYKKHFSGKSIKGGVLSLWDEHKFVENADDGFVNEFANQKINETIHIFKESLAFYEDTLDFINKIRRGKIEIKDVGLVGADPIFAMVTGLEKTLLDEVLKHHDLQQIFTIFVTPDSYAHSKPNPECYLKALAAMNLAPNECIGIEDAPAGVAALNNADIFSIGLTTTHSEKELSDSKLLTDSLTTLIS